MIGRPCVTRLTVSTWAGDVQIRCGRALRLSGPVASRPIGSTFAEEHIENPASSNVRPTERTPAFVNQFWHPPVIGVALHIPDLLLTTAVPQYCLIRAAGVD